MKQFEKLQPILEPFPTSIGLHKLNRRKNKKIMDWHAHHHSFVERWNNPEAHIMPHEHHTRGNYWLSLKLAWTFADTADDPKDLEEVNEYDTAY
uniref:Aminotransferase-like plant mobile domain-containing protein n=1 Tax=Leersia perrieri TaxID=77586 RepID=A0A0D9XSF4_9ORYZ